MLTLAQMLWLATGCVLWGGTIIFAAFVARECLRAYRERTRAMTELWHTGMLLVDIRREREAAAQRKAG